MTDDYLGLAGKRFLVFGVANRKSIATHVARTLTQAGAEVVYVVRNLAVKASVQHLLESIAPDPEIHVCDVEFADQIEHVHSAIGRRHGPFDGLLHSLAFADYDPQRPAFHETPKQVFLRCVDISCYSLIALAGAFQDMLCNTASVVTISISTTRMASENYGFMAPAKAALDASLAFLAKSFSAFSEIRFNAVGPGLLKTSASAGIPGYVESYLFAEQATLRKRAVATEEAAHVAVFLLSPRSSGINGQKIVVDAGMSVNYFDQDIVARTVR